MVLAVQRGLEDHTFAMLWLISCTFLLRLPSEAGVWFRCSWHGSLSLHLQALPTCKAHPEDSGASLEQSLIWREGDYLCFRMLRRKNRQRGSGVLKRVCSCKGGTAMCPIHTLWDKFFALLPQGARPWENISAGKARDRLRLVLSKLQVPDWAEYGTHDFRRGHAEVGPVLTSFASAFAVLLHRTCARAVVHWYRYCWRDNGSLHHFSSTSMRHVAPLLFCAPHSVHTSQG